MWQAIIDWLKRLFSRSAQSQNAPVIPIRKGVLIPPPPAFETYDFDYKGGEYSLLLEHAQISHGHDSVIADCKKILAVSDIYKGVEAKTGVPWFIIGVIHLLEASLDFRACLHNGEHIIGTGRKTTLVPAGRGPFATWEDAAIDALGIDGAAKVKEWDIESALSFLEHYNGMGYRSHGIHSPYLWSYTTQYSKGKYIADGHYDSEAISQQIGCCAIFLGMQELKVHLPGLMK